jgi:hypothetical protein
LPSFAAAPFHMLSTIRGNWIRYVCGGWLLETARQTPRQQGAAAYTLFGLAAISARYGETIRAARQLASAERWLAENERVMFRWLPGLEEARRPRRLRDLRERRSCQHLDRIATKQDHPVDADAHVEPLRLRQARLRPHRARLVLR